MDPTILYKNLSHRNQDIKPTSFILSGWKNRVREISYEIWVMGHELWMMLNPNTDSLHFIIHISYPISNKEATKLDPLQACTYIIKRMYNTGSKIRWRVWSVPILGFYSKGPHKMFLNWSSILSTSEHSHWVLQMVYVGRF